MDSDFPATEAVPFGVGIVTLVPDIWPQLLAADTGLVGKAFADGRARLSICDLRPFGLGRHQQVDDAPFGGGAGMVLRVEPLHQAIQAARQATPGPVVLLSARGEPFRQSLARRLATGPGLILVCGRYEGVDERVVQYVDLQVSMGDYVLSAGDPAAWSLVDAVVRLRPGVLGNAASLDEESFAGGMLEYPQYTRPAEYDGAAVPEVLRSGDHQAVAEWRADQAREWTATCRPDLLGDKE